MATVALGALASSIVTAASASTATERVAGVDRYDTAAAVSRAAFPDGTSTVFLASGKTYADALAAAPVAAAEGGPVLLTDPDAVPVATRAELDRLRPSAVVVVGGTSAVSAATAASAGATERVMGSDRYATAAALARRLHPGGEPVEALYVASGESFADALAGAAPAARDGAPILLTTRTQLPSAAAAELSRLRPGTTTVLGGPAVVDRALEAAIGRLTAGAVGRSEGRDRWATSVAVSVNAYAPGLPVAYLASGDAFADGLAGAVLAGRTAGPVLLSPAGCMPARVAGELDRLAPQRLVVLGGDAAVGPDALARTTCPQPHDPRPVSRERPMTVLVLGDSMATEPAYSLERLYEWFGGAILTSQAKQPGTGLNRPDVFDWVAATPRLIAEHDPDVVTMIIGANDTDEMSMPDGRRVAFGSDEWRAEYTRRVGQVMEALAVDGRLVVWTSEPVMGREPLNSNVDTISDLMAGVAAVRGVTWLDSRPLFSDSDGRYVNNGWRMADEIHFTPAGADRLVGAQLDLILARWRV